MPPERAREEGANEESSNEETGTLQEQRKRAHRRHPHRVNPVNISSSSSPQILLFTPAGRSFCNREAAGFHAPSPFWPRCSGTAGQPVRQGNVTVMRTTTERNKDLVPRSNGLEPTGTLTMLIPPPAIHSHRRLPRREAVKRLDAPGLPVAGSRATTQRDPRRAREGKVGVEELHGQQVWLSSLCAISIGSDSAADAPHRRRSGGYAGQRPGRYAGRAT